jgi:hypothetical protein
MEELKLNQDFRWIITRETSFSQEECDELIKYIDKHAERKEDTMFLSGK